MEQRKFEEGLRYMQEGLEMSIEVNGERHRTTHALLINLGMAFSELGRFLEAESILNKAFELNKELLGAEHPNTLQYLAESMF
jgi:hypothetical protein